VSARGLAVHLRDVDRTVDDAAAAPHVDDGGDVGVPRRVRLGMPHLGPAGLAEGWLFRHAGDLHWDEISRRLGVATDDIRDDGRARIYPTVVALRARYDAPLRAVRENDVFDARVEVMPCGRACAQGRIVATAGAARLSLELVTTFASRQSDGTMRAALPAARLAARWTPVAPPSRLALLARAARRGERLDDAFAGPTLEPTQAPLGRVRHEPSPYVDYNGAGLLYFAAYPTLADTLERQLVRRLACGARTTGDWALATSPVARDVFYYGNLPLGEALDVELLSLEPDGVPGRGPRGVKSRVRLRRARDGRAIADVITRRLFVAADGASREACGGALP
jgi:probable biosynthetic protein (TIGR04098 family)